ncbi:MAG: transposase [Acidobacteriota bacterium]
MNAEVLLGCSDGYREDIVEGHYVIETYRDLGLTRSFAALLEDERAPGRRRHDRREQLRQRVCQIALGYEDCLDANYLRHDPAMQHACGSGDQPLSSQSTLSRLENAVTGREHNRLWREFERQYARPRSALRRHDAHRL